ncbi:MAG: hypothetical protein V7L25_13875 [Nostoc sp.]|uniref:hypothetical protein n=1 Tax=Nostoc sp. TaxID=1180 RepID=UPI002FF19F08
MSGLINQLEKFEKILRDSRPDADPTETTYIESAKEQLSYILNEVEKHRLMIEDEFYKQLDE